MAESPHKLLPSDSLRISMGDGEVIPPFQCGTGELVRGKQDSLTIGTLCNIQLLSDSTDPVIGFVLLENVGGRMRMKSAMVNLCVGGGGGAVRAVACTFCTLLRD